MQYSIILMLLCNLVGALPLQFPSSNHQEPLLQVNAFHPADASTSNQHLERAPKSAELLFTAHDDDQMVHIWLPLGKRMYPRDYPILPLHPTTVRISNVLDTTTEASFHQWEVMCVITPKIDARERKSQEGSRKTSDIQEELAVSIQESDNMADLEDAEAPWFLAGREVESYECF